MFTLIADFYKIRARTDGVGKTCVFIQLFTHLVKISHIDFGTALDITAIGFYVTQNQLEQSGFAYAIGAEQANFIATQNTCAEVFNQRFITV